MQRFKALTVAFLQYHGAFYSPLCYEPRAMEAKKLQQHKLSNTGNVITIQLGHKVVLLKLDKLKWLSATAEEAQSYSNPVLAICSIETLNVCTVATKLRTFLFIKFTEATKHATN